uniref:Uncharacterized protein n=1 Tax=Oryza glumipatula TaxID=40148 RepID=A0A0E0A0Z8_9ORYZ
MASLRRELGALLEQVASVHVLEVQGPLLLRLLGLLPLLVAGFTLRRGGIHLGLRVEDGGVAAPDAADDLEHLAVDAAGRDGGVIVVRRGLVVVVVLLLLLRRDEALLLALLQALQRLPPLVVLEAAGVLLVDLDLGEILLAAASIGLIVGAREDVLLLLLLLPPLLHGCRCGGDGDDGGGEAGGN